MSGGKSACEVSELDLRVLRAMDDEWINLGQFVGVGMSRRALTGRLRSLRSRGLVDFRVPDHDHRPVGEWALTSDGDRIAWGST